MKQSTGQATVREYRYERKFLVDALDAALDTVQVHALVRRHPAMFYYATRDGRFRLTMDSGMAYYQVKRAGNRFRNRSLDEQHIIVELKYDRSLDPRAGRVSSFFPFSITRSSKYVTGIERVYP